MEVTFVKKINQRKQNQLEGKYSHSGKERSDMYIWAVGLETGRSEKCLKIKINKGE